MSDVLGHPHGLRGTNNGSVEPESSNQFPWVTAIMDANGACFIRTQIDHGNFIDVAVSKKKACFLVSVLAEFVAK